MFLWQTYYTSESPCTIFFYEKSCKVVLGYNELIVDSMIDFEGEIYNVLRLIEEYYLVNGNLFIYIR